MKKVLSVISLAALLTGCNETVEKLSSFSKPKLRDADSSTEKRHATDSTDIEDGDVSTALHEPNTVENRVELPTVRSLTDVHGRSIEARILAKKGNMIAIAKLPTNQPFVLSLDNLAEADRLSLASLNDGGDSGAFGVSRKVPVNRRAVWHSHIANAEKEAARFGIPLLVAILVNESPSASNLEKSLAYSGEFKSWADRNVALCMIRTDGFRGTESRESTYDTWKSLQKYGIGQSAESSLVLIDPGNFTSTKIKSRGASSSRSTISNIEAAIHGQSGWSSIVAAKAPVRAESPFKVASRPTVSNCGST